MGWSLDLPSSFPRGKTIVRLVWRLHFLPDGDQFGAQHDGSGASRCIMIGSSHNGYNILINETFLWELDGSFARFRSLA